MRYIILTDKEREQLEQSYKTSTNFIERSRSLQLLLSDRKNSMADVSWTPYQSLLDEVQK